jgi:hypothetical protein
MQLPSSDCCMTTIVVCSPISSLHPVIDEKLGGSRLAKGVPVAPCFAMVEFA